MPLHAAKWLGYVDDGATVQIVATMTAFEPRRIDLDDAPDSVTVTIYEHVPDDRGIHELIGISVRFEVPLPTPLAGRPVIDGASGERRDAKPRWKGSATPVPVGEEFRWKD